MTSFNIYNPNNLPQLSNLPSKDDLEAFAEYGNQEIETLAHQFEGVVTDSSAEWSSFRQFMGENCSEMKHKDVVFKLMHRGDWYEYIC